jgi:hypothetical protein
MLGSNLHFSGSGPLNDPPHNGEITRYRLKLHF